MQLGTELTIVLSSREAIHEAYVKKSRQFSDKPAFPSFGIANYGFKGLFLANLGDQYKHNKAMNHRAISKVIIEQVLPGFTADYRSEKMITLFDNHMLETRAICPMREFGYIVPSVMMSFMFGENHSYESPELSSYIDCIQKWFENQELIQNMNFLNYKIMKVLHNERLNIIEKCVKFSDDFILKKLKSLQHCDVKNPCLLSFYF